MNNNRIDVMRLLDEYNKNPNQFTDEQAEKIAQVAKAYGVSFKRENKAGRKFAFDMADTALLGLVPNEWRPTSRGQETYGETGVDKFASALGITAGIVGTSGLALANAPRIGASAGRLVGKGMGYGSHYAPKAYSKGMEYAGRGYSKASDLGSRAMAQGRKIYAEGPSLAGRAGARFERGRMAGQRAFNKGTTSLDRGTSTSYFGNLRNEFEAGRRMANPMSNYNPNLLLLTEGGYGGGVPLARGGGVML